MSIETIRKSALVAGLVAVIAVAGLLAGRVSATAFPHGRGDFAARAARISRALDLTDDQRAKIKDILKTHADEIRTQMQASAGARKALHDAVMAQPADETAIRAAAQQVGQTQGDGAVLFAKIRAEVDPILTSEQKGKIQTFQQKVRQRGNATLQSFDNFLRSGS